MGRRLLDAVRLTLALTLLTGVIYPLLLTGVAQLLLPWQANGSLLRDARGRVIGSERIGQPFTAPGYFHGRPSETSAGPYDASASGASNLGPSNPRLADRIAARVAAFRAENPAVDRRSRLPVDLVTASGSGLDPDLSLAGVLLQVPRVARARGLPDSVVAGLVRARAHASSPAWFGPARVAVLPLNLELDRLAAARGAAPAGPAAP